MERKESAHGLQLVKFAAIKLKGHFSALFMGTFAMVTPLVLAVVLPLIIAWLTGYTWIISIGIILFAIFVGPLQVGYIKFFNETLDGKQPKTRLIYSQIRFSPFTLRIIYISTLLLLMYIIGGMLWIITAGFAVSFFSMTLFFLEKYEYPRLSVAMKDCAKRMVTNRLAMFSYKLIFYFIYFLIFCIALLMAVLVTVLVSENIIISWVVAVCSTIVFIFLYTIVTVYFHSANQVFFEDVLIREEKRKARKQEKKLEQIAVSNKEEKVEDDSANQTKDVELLKKSGSKKTKTTTKKSNAKKSPTKKKTTKESK